MAISLPTGLGASAITTTRIDSTWTNNDTYTSLVVYRKIAGGSYSPISSTLPGTTTSYSDTTCSSNTNYYYKVLAIKGVDSGYSNEDDAWTAPTAPTIGTVTVVSSSALTPTWTNNDTYSSVKVYRSSALIATIAGASTSYGNTGLTSNTTYTYKVAGYNSSSGLTSAFSSTANGLTLPAAPSSMNATVETGETGESEIGLTWTNNDSYSSVVVQKKEGSGAWATHSTEAGGATSKAVTGLTSATKYTFRAYGTNASGNSGYSNEDYDYTRPDQPSGLTATANGSSQIDLSWTNNDTYSSVYIYRKKSGDADFSVVTSIAGASTSYSNTGLDANTLYYYKVNGVANGKNSVYSSEASDTTNNAYANVITDTFTMSESVTDDTAKLDTIADTITMSESVTGTRGFAKTITDTITMSDAVLDGVAVATDIAIFLGSENGKVYHLSGDYTSDDGSSLVSTIELKQMDFNDQFPQYTDQYKFVDQVRLWYVDLETDTTLTLGVSTDGGTTWSYYDNVVGASAGVAKSTDFYFRSTAHTFKFKVTHASTTESLQLLGMQVFFKVFGKVF